MSLCALCGRVTLNPAVLIGIHPVGPTCAKKLDLSRKTQDRAARVVRDTRTLDIFPVEAT